MATVQSLTRALGILSALCERNEPVAPAELSRDHGLHITTVLRLLSTLEHDGYITRLASGRYRPSSRFVLLASQWSHLAPGRTLLRSTLEALADLTGETAMLTVRSGLLRILVDWVDSPRTLRIAADGDGLTFPLLDGGTGYALMCDANKADMDRVEEALRRRFGPRAVLPKEQADLILAGIRADGYGLFETLAGRGVAIPVRAADGQVVCAIGVIGPLERWTARRIKEQAGEMLDIVSDLTADLDSEASLVRAQLAEGPAMRRAARG